ncbi:hypothetical protein NDU88_003693 [Pleurodeles waltl]|uniref:Retrotransposon gag domain-containing protein n=1 Tax=Pleurodeles waltl TaxID=8319 RepID=A0AAV7QAS1_PLEWA|nr:hypothetical protein NDU88_003693 [Pleurodeles waltl]
MSAIPALEPFINDGPPSAQAARWKDWVDRLEIYFTSVHLDTERRLPMLLHLGGAAIHKSSKSIAEEGPPFTYQSVKKVLTAHFEPLAYPDYERFILRQARQLPKDSADTFYAQLLELASTCTLPDAENEIWVQFIQGCYSVKLQQNIL